MSDRIGRLSHDRLGRIVMRAGRLNVLTTSDVRALTQALRELDGNSVVVLESELEHFFCAGMDVADHRPVCAPAMLEAIYDLIVAFEQARPIMIAKVCGPALGGGFELVLLCDLAIASAAASFALPEVRLAALPPVAAGLLPRAVGERRALDLILSGRSLSAQEALAWGIISSLASPENLDAAVGAVVEQLLSLSEPALLACKRAVRAASTTAALRIYRNQLLPLADAAEGVNAFLEKRAPAWEHTRRTPEVNRV